MSRTSGATQPKPEIYGHLTSEELEDVFGDVHDHPNDLIVDGMRKLNDKYIALRKVGEVCWHKLELLLLPNTVRLLPGTWQSEDGNQLQAQLLCLKIGRPSCLIV